MKTKAQAPVSVSVLMLVKIDGKNIGGSFQALGRHA
jgi:hypothetical protein